MRVYMNRKRKNWISNRWVSRLGVRNQQVICDLIKAAVTLKQHLCVVFFYCASIFFPGNWIVPVCGSTVSCLKNRQLTAEFCSFLHPLCSVTQQVPLLFVSSSPNHFSLSGRSKFTPMVFGVLAKNLRGGKLHELHCVLILWRKRRGSKI